MAVVQRFGGALNLNVHVHALAIDGVFARDGAGVRFWPAPVLHDLDVAEVLATIVARVRRLLERRGMGAGDEDGGASDGGAEDLPVLDCCGRRRSDSNAADRPGSPATCRPDRLW